MRRPVHVLEQGADVQDIVNMAAVAVIDAQARGHHPTPTPHSPPPPAAEHPAGREAGVL
jgi:malate dehydrogenase (oxaloacetate-decarboxylating)(NADP+)